MLLYQSKIWREINEEVFGRNIWEINLNSSIKWGITKTKRFKNLGFNIYQLLGVNAVFKKELLKKDIQYVTSKVFTNRRDIYLQI